MNTREGSVVQFVAPREFGVLDLRQHPDLVAQNIHYLAFFLLHPRVDESRLASGVFTVTVHQREMPDVQSVVDDMGCGASHRSRTMDLPAGPAVLLTELTDAGQGKAVLHSHAVLADGPRTVQLSMATEDTGDWPDFAVVFEGLLQTVSFPQSTVDE